MAVPDLTGQVFGCWTVIDSMNSEGAGYSDVHGIKREIKELA